MRSKLMETLPNGGRTVVVPTSSASWSQCWATSASTRRPARPASSRRPSDQGGVTFGGHARKAHVHPTLKVTLTETPAHVTRKIRPELGGMLLIEVGKS